MNIQNTIILNEKEALDSLLQKGFSIIDCQINKEISDYKFLEKNNKRFFFEKNKLKPIKEAEDFFISLRKTIRIVYNKNPLIGDLISEILISESFYNPWENDQVELLDKAIKIKPLITDRDTLRHLKNYGFNFNKEIEDLKIKNDNALNKKSTNRLSDRFSTIEKLDDEIFFIIGHQKAKRLIQKIYNSKTKHLIEYQGKVREDVIENYKILVENKVELSKIKEGFSKKIARFKSEKEHDDALNNYINELFNWNKSSFLNKAKKLGAKIESDDKNILCLKIRSYEQSKKLGSGQWCLSYSEDYFKDYKKNHDSIYFLYDFSKKQINKESMLGVVLNDNAEIMNAHWRNDDEIENDNDEIKMFENYIPKEITKEDVIENIQDSLKEKNDNMEYTLTVISESGYLSFNWEEHGLIDMLEESEVREKWDKGYDRFLAKKFLKIFNRTKIQEHDTAIEILKKKTINGSILKMLKNFDQVYVGSVKDDFIEAIIKRDEKELLHTMLEKIDETSDFSFLIKHLNEDIVVKLRDIKERRISDLFYPENLGKYLLENKWQEESVNVLKVLELNNYNINLTREIDLYCQYEPHNEDSLPNKRQDKVKELLLECIPNMPKSELQKIKSQLKNHKIESTDDVLKCVNKNIENIKKKPKF